MEAITCGIKKVKYYTGDYWKCYVTANETGQTLYSREMFIDRKTARHHAEWWKYECLQVGTLIDA